MVNVCNAANELNPKLGSSINVGEITEDNDFVRETMSAKIVELFKLPNQCVWIRKAQCTIFTLQGFMDVCCALHLLCDTLPNLIRKATSNIDHVLRDAIARILGQDLTAMALANDIQNMRFRT